MTIDMGTELDEFDTKRLEALALYDIMDTPPDPEFDDIVFLASEICRTPVALISLVERDRQWFKARVGFEACETPIEQSVCAHALGSHDLLVIPDLAADPRTARNTLVTSPPHIRFYAGAPLITPDGVVVGTLCVIDTQPRAEAITERQGLALEALARQIVIMLELRRVLHRKDHLFKRQKHITSTIRANVQATVSAQEAGRIGTFEITIPSDIVKVSAEMCRIFDLPIADSYPASVFEGLMVDEDRNVQSTASSRSDGTALLDVEYRINTAQRGIRWISRHASFSGSEPGKPERMFGTVRDITREKRESLRLQALLAIGDSLGDAASLDGFSPEAAKLIAVALGAVRAGFGIVDLSNGTINVLSDWALPGVPSMVGRHRVSDYGAYMEDLEQGRSVRVEDVTASPLISDGGKALAAWGIRGLLNIPIRNRGRLDLVAFAHHAQPHAWTPEETDFLRGIGDRLLTAVTRIRAEGEQKMLNRELSHRLKNSFAMVQAIASQTLKSVPDRAPVLKLEKRLQALSTAHDVLLQQNWSGADVRTVVTKTLDRLGAIDRFRIEGPSVILGPKATMSLTLVIHELATNAVKYGALSSETGRVLVAWTIEPASDDPVFQFSWSEEGGPPVQQAGKKGFGSKLINMGLMGTGDVVTRYDYSGFSTLMTAPLAQLQQAD